MSRLSLNFPPLVAMSIEVDREFCNAAAHCQHRVNPDWRAHAALLSDLTRPPSRDAWLRWLGAALGWPESVHCPDFRWMPPLPLSARSAGWHIGLPGQGFVRFGADAFGDWHHIPNLDVSGPDAWPVALGQVIQYVAAQQVPK